MVIIDNKLFYLDFANRLVAVTSDLSLRESLKNGEFDSNEVYLFSFKDEVLELLEKGSEGTIFSKSKNEIENRRVNAFYVGDNCEWDECRYNEDTPGTTGMDYRLEAKFYSCSKMY